MSRRSRHYKKMLGYEVLDPKEFNKVIGTSKCGGDPGRVLATLPNNVSERRVALVRKWIGMK
jgi:hypothetical protein